MDMDKKEALHDVCEMIYKQIATLRRGMPIAEAKASSVYERLKVRRQYLDKLNKLDAQYKAVWAILVEACV